MAIQRRLQKKTPLQVGFKQSYERNHSWLTIAQAMDFYSILIHPICGSSPASSLSHISVSQLFDHLTSRRQWLIIGSHTSNDAPKKAPWQIITFRNVLLFYIFFCKPSFASILRPASSRIAHTTVNIENIDSIYAGAR